MPLLNGSVDRLIMEERSKMRKYLAGQIDLRIEIDKEDRNVLNGMEDERIWLEKRL